MTVAYKQQAVPRKRGGLGIFYRSDPDLRHENERLSPNSRHEFLQCPCPARLRRAVTTVTGFVTIAGTRRVSVEPGRAIGSRRFQLTALEHHESTPFSSQAVVRRRLARRPGLRPRLRDAAAARAAVLTAPIVRRTTARRRSPVPRGRRIRAAPSGRLRRFGASAAPHHRARGYVWTNGYWRWPGGRSVWIPGRWIAQRPGHRGSPAIGDNGQTCGSISTDAGIACAASRTPFAAKAAKRIGEREAAAHRRRRTPRTRFRRSDLSNAPARPRGPETNQRRGKRAGTPAAARGFLPTAPNDAIASIAGFHRP
ncbi:YXWGXW repeat-containing protein [Burkholderia pseudomallei]|uniref:YXWGXW repeat-containing protein n=1 Tax=Burkholderia pseudomallei TaxID=28450 RepID=A0A8A4DLF7_BURPE|nr:YXWGXW repeat-containing protein [Burkholderia pseudomallei]QWM25485.1 YXWGXW repeat-containing protein [Burkholderia pseudomallei]QWV53588.1 YXWGXW repeat-containing protein [Burkholderia pseudomallei]